MKALAVSILTLALLGVSFAQERDQVLEDAVWAKLKSEKLDKQVAEVVATDGNVTLRGKPSNAFMKMKAIEAALGVEGVEGVEDELDIAAPESDEDFVKDLVSAVLNYGRFTVFDDVGFQIQDGGIVVLTGYVTEPIKKRELEERVGKVTGVRELQNVIEVLPVGGGDDRVRRALYDNIYGDQVFIQYRNRAHPPIRLVVNRGNVILSGAVRNRIEQMKAETIARSTFGVIGVDNRLQINP
jgi:osmotically-inducible protein OsmY